MGTDFLLERKQRLENYRKNIRHKQPIAQKVDVPDGLFVKCEGCSQLFYEAEISQQMGICPRCDFHFRLGINERLSLTVDPQSFIELDANLTSLNPLDMPEYEDKLAKGLAETTYPEAFVGGKATLGGINVAVGVLNSFFMMGSMGSVVGEKITRLVEYALEHRLPLILFSASGGARMQEGLYSLMQMAKTSAAIGRFHQAGLLYISVLTHPTTGGVAASFASLGDINIAEPGALIGFAGARVIRQTIKEELPNNFQTASFQLEHGQIDLIVHRRKMRITLIQLLKLHIGGFDDGTNS